MKSEKTTSITLRDLLHILFKRKKIILLFFSLTLCIVALLPLLVKPTYEATAHILVKIGRENLYVPTLPTNQDASAFLSRDLDEEINSEIEILKSRILAEKVVEKLGPSCIYSDINEAAHASLSGHRKQSLGAYVRRFLSGPSQRRVSVLYTPVEEAAIRLQKNLKVHEITKSSIIEVAFKHEDAHTAATVLNTFIDGYFERHLEVHKSPHSYKFSRDQVELYKKRLRQSEEGLHSFKSRHNVASLAEQRSLLLSQEAALHADLNETQRKMAEIQNRTTELRRQLAVTPKTVLLEEEVDHNPTSIRTLQEKLVELELQEKKLLSKYTEESRLVKDLKAEIQMLQRKLKEQEKKRSSLTRSGLNTIYQNIEVELLRNETDLHALRAKEKILNEQLVSYRRDLEKLSSIEVELNQLQREVDLDQKNYRLYESKFEEARVSEAMDFERIANVSLIEPARPPLNPVGRKQMMLAILWGGLGVGIGLAFALEYLDDSLEKPEDVEKLLKLPVLASIPDTSR